MTIIDPDLSAKMYYNTHDYFRKHYIDNLPNDIKLWAERYREWLAEQGCFIVRSERPILRNGLDIAPHYDRFSFKHEKDATMFVLRWS